MTVTATRGSNTNGKGERNEYHFDNHRDRTFLRRHYSHVRNIKSEVAKQEYASFSHNYTTVTADMYYLPENQSKADKYTGYVSLQQSGKDCLFEQNPIIYITQETACMYYGLQLMFGSSLPDGIIFRTFNDGVKVDEYEITADITKKLIVQEAKMQQSPENIKQPAICT